jgi:Glycosyl hydrolase-like 10
MTFQLRSQKARSQKLCLKTWCLGLTSLLLASSPFGSLQSTLAAQMGSYCQQSPTEIAEKEKLRVAAVAGEAGAQERYQALVRQHAAILTTCRGQRWPQTMAVWLRLYPCDTKPGVMEEVLDRIVNQGYNQVYVETFYDGQVLLPSADNPTPWTPVVRAPGYEKTDLLAESIQKGRARGLKVYAWMFSLNFGYSYAQRADRKTALARNGHGQTSLDLANTDSISVSLEGDQADKVFVDPYHPRAKQDFYQLVNLVLKRRPDGILYDYIRYPKGTQGASIAARPQDLWVYGEASQQALLGRALNNKGQEFIRLFYSKGSISPAEFAAVNKRYPQEKVPLWQGFNPSPKLTLSQLQYALWQLGVAHAMQGVNDFLSWGVYPAQRQGVTAGAVFFPGANRMVRQGYDSRLQPWDRFPSSIEWHPMSYAVCNDGSCIVNEVQEVLRRSASGTQVIPALAGFWRQSLPNRPALELQMQAIRAGAPQINAISHFAYSWQEPKSESTRRACRLPSL